MHFKKIVGSKCYLSPATQDDAQKFAEWMNDFEIAKELMDGHEPTTADKERKKIVDANERGAYHFSIIDLETDALIGKCEISWADMQNQTGFFRIYIGDKSYWGKGYGTEATRLLLDFAFNVLNLNSMGLGVYSYNKRAIRAYEKVGFQIAGTRREARRLGGRFYDVIIMDILAREFESVYVKKIIDAP